MRELKDYVNDIPNWPIEGVTFKDITPLLQTPHAYQNAVDLMTAYCRSHCITHIVSPDARGWLFACPVAYNLSLPLDLIRKPGKLPPNTIHKTYEYEYASGSLEMKVDASIHRESTVAIIDDVNATGGTAMAIVEMLYEKGVTDIHYVSLIDLTFLNGSVKLKDAGVKCTSLIKYE